MWKRLISPIRRSVRAWLGIPPPEARVDPALFPEADYPVFCMRCGYNLRGLLDERCPECAEPFERGRLLVEQYARCKRPRSDGRYRFARKLQRLGWVLMIGSIIIWASFRVAGMLWNDAIIELATNGRFGMFVAVLLIPRGIGVLGMSCLFTSSLVELTTLPPRQKRRAVREALRATLRRSSDARQPIEGR